MKHVILGLSILFALMVAMLPSASALSLPAAGGAQLFSENCASCHSATTTTKKIGPGLKGLFKAKTLPASGKPATVANVTARIKNGGGGMPAFGSNLSAQEINEIIAYLKTL